MGYRAEKEKIEKKIRLIKIVALCVALAILLGFCLFSAFYPPATWKYYVKKPKVSKRENGEMRIHFLDVGQGDCTLIELPDGKVALIDGGDATERTAQTVLRRLNALKIETIDYLIVTHTDNDHCGSLKKVVEQKRILNAYLPATKPEKEGHIYAGFYQEILEENCATVLSSRIVDMSGANYTFTFVYPYSLDVLDVENYNGQSSIVWLDYLGISTIFMADATESVEELLMRDSNLGLLENIEVDLDSTEIIKVGHHGSAYSTSLDFLQYLNVNTAVISCGVNNPYGHPTEKVLDNVALVGAELYRTDVHGTVMISVKGADGYAIEASK
jgi:competence protein ComEC